MTDPKSPLSNNTFNGPHKDFKCVQQKPETQFEKLSHRGKKYKKAIEMQLGTNKTTIKEFRLVYKGQKIRKVVEQGMDLMR